MKGHSSQAHTDVVRRLENVGCHSSTQPSHPSLKQILKYASSTQVYSHSHSYLLLVFTEINTYKYTLRDIQDVEIPVYTEYTHGNTSRSGAMAYIEDSQTTSSFSELFEDFFFYVFHLT